MIKKIIIVALIIFPITIYACEPSEKIKLNTLSSLVNYTYNYDYNTKKFNLVLENITDELLIQYNSKEYSKKNNIVTINNLNEGTIMNVKVYATLNTGCYTEYLRGIYLTIPYRNTYYDSQECDNYREYTICSTEFLPYQVSESIFSNAINKIDGEQKLEESTTIIMEENENFFERIFSYIKENYIPYSLVIGTSLITFFIGSMIFRKIKYKF